MIKLTQQSLLHSRAPSLILLMPSDGIVLDSRLSRLFHQYKNEYDRYKAMAYKGDLTLGSVIHFDVQKQATGLMIGSNQYASYLSLAITHSHHKDTPKIAALKDTCLQLKPALFKLMRYQHLRHSAIDLTKIAIDDVNAHLPKLSDWLDVPRLSIDGHIAKTADKAPSTN